MGNPPFSPFVNLGRHWRHSRDKMFPCLSPPFLHTASDQKLDDGKVWEWGYKIHTTSYSFSKYSSVPTCSDKWLVHTKNLLAPSKYTTYTNEYLGISEYMMAMYLVLRAHERYTVLCILQAMDYTCMLMWSVTCARQVKIGYYHGNELLMVFMHIATKCMKVTWLECELCTAMHSSG